jgi:run domain Beclin-1 interacting cysteine-rich containing protein
MILLGSFIYLLNTMPVCGVINSCLNISAYMKRLRYCEYLGKFFCQCCHSNTMFFIPGRILRKWDFSKYTVSNFSKDVLTKMYDDPLFNISDINLLLYRKVRALEMIRECRIQLYHIYLFIKTCRMASG